MMTAMHEARSRVLLPPMFGPVSSSVRAGVDGEPSCRSFATMQPPSGARAHGCHTCRLGTQQGCVTQGRHGTSGRGSHTTMHTGTTVAAAGEERDDIGCRKDS